MIIDIHRHNAVRIMLLTLAAIIMASCELPKDKIIDYSKLAGTITGFSRPTYMKCVGNHLFVLDDNGLYRLNLAQIDFSGDTVSSSDLLYRNNSIGSYGRIKHFDVSGSNLFLITYSSDSSYHYILKIDMTAANLTAGLSHYTLPNNRSANYITVCGDSLVISGNANITLKGYQTTDASGDIIFDTTTDYRYAYDYDDVDNITVASMKPIAYQNSNKYNIFLVSCDTDQMGIRKYLCNTDLTSDRNIHLKSTCKTTLYPLDIQFKPSDRNTIISSEVSGVVLYSVATNADDTVTLTKTNTIGLGEDNGAMKTLPYGDDKLVTLYGYQVKANEYDEHAYDIMAYWYGAKVISDAYTGNAQVTKSYTIEGWGTDFAIFDDYILTANQVKNCINIIKLD